MKTVILALCLTINALPQCSIVGKRASSTYQSLPDTKYVLIYGDTVHVVPVDNSNFAADLPCGIYTVGSPTVRGYYFRSKTVETRENELCIVNLIGAPTLRLKKTVDY